MFKDPKGGRPSLQEYIVILIIVAIIIIIVILAVLGRLLGCYSDIGNNL